jgi:hypothetical protein
MERAGRGREAWREASGQERHSVGVGYGETREISGRYDHDTSALDLLSLVRQSKHRVLHLPGYA